LQRTNKKRQKGNMWPVIFCLLIAAAYALQTRTAADEKTQAVIHGIVRSSDGTPLYGILVCARSSGKSYSTYVFTDQNGSYDFPVLPLGAYQVSVGTARKESVQLTASGVTQDFGSVQLGRDFMNQTTGPNWLKVIPGNEADKERAARYCASCHTTSRRSLSDRYGDKLG
jgi:hypothetical protein